MKTKISGQRGSPLSPYLFFLVMNMLTKDKATLQYKCIGKQAINIEIIINFLEVIVQENKGIM